MTIDRSALPRDGDDENDDGDEWRRTRRHTHRVVVVSVVVVVVVVVVSVSVVIHTGSGRSRVLGRSVVIDDVSRAFALARPPTHSRPHARLSRTHTSLVLPNVLDVVTVTVGIDTAPIVTSVDARPRAFALAPRSRCEVDRSRRSGASSTESVVVESRSIDRSVGCVCVCTEGQDSRRRLPTRARGGENDARGCARGGGVRV